MAGSIPPTAVASPPHCQALEELQERRFPPISPIDTCVWEDGGWKSIHGKGILFPDDVIVAKEAIVKQVEQEGLEVRYTRHEKAIVLQQATRGCTAAATAMLILDNGGEVAINTLRSRNVGNLRTQERDIEQAGFTAIVNEAPTLQLLRDLIVKNGSAIISINHTIGSHAVVIDDISEDLQTIRLRDPYHGWEITVATKNFPKLSAWDPIIQVQRKG